METPSSENTSHSKSSSNKSAIDEPSIPYFLPHSDSPGLVLVSQPLTRDNYASWSRAMLIAWSVKNKLGFVDGSIVKPKGIDLDFLHSWTRNNKIVIAWILNSVSKEISASVIFGDSTREIWLNLKDPLQQRNGLRIFQLRRELMNLVQDQNSISVYLLNWRLYGRNWAIIGQFVLVVVWRILVLTIKWNISCLFLWD